MANIDRVNAQIKKELFSLINYNLNDPRIDETITISFVNTTKDLKYCKVYICMSQDADKEGIIKALQSSANFLRKELFSRLRVRTVPELKFFVDESLDYAFHINEILKSLDIKKDE